MLQSSYLVTKTVAIATHIGVFSHTVLIAKAHAIIQNSYIAYIMYNCSCVVTYI